MKSYLVAANWKMNKTATQTSQYLEVFKQLLGDGVAGVEIMIAPAFTSLQAASVLLANTSIKLGAQNMYHEDNGAFTGEVSPVMLKEFGVDYVILGHSERRHIFGEKDEMINKKVQAALKHGVRPVLCVGETLEERELGKTLAVVERQIRLGLAGVEEQVSMVDIAYEPVWAIGTGVNATPQQAQEVHAFIRQLLHDISKGNDTGCRIVYGGSVNENNAPDLIKEKDIEGFLVGTASLDPSRFYKIALSCVEV